MGEVYRARDVKLGRDVAIKILPLALRDDPERLARFEREARTLAALSHLNIAHVHGFEDSSGVPALIMELVEGATLADRIAKGPIPLDEALPIAKQIAEALEAAHEQGIIHRDLKPANVKVRPDGTVKVLDFGLAKALERPTPNVDATQSPTITTPAAMTNVGVILGTAAYMAPEQARGKPVDKRADIWAFGCVLFEMLTGRRAFEEEDISTTSAAVLKGEPRWSALPAALPPGVRRLLRRCLQKDPKARLRDVGEARIAIDDVLSKTGEESAPVPAVRPAVVWHRMAAMAVVVPATALLTGVLVWFAARSTAARPRTWRFHVTPPSAEALTINGLTRDVALTPDGSRLIYIGANGTTLFVRPLDQLEATPLIRGAALRDPFVSPDGQWVGFFDGPFTLEKVAITGGPAVPVTRLDSFEQGATWAADDTIIFATTGVASGLQRMSANGGKREVLTRPERALGEVSHVWPEALPGGEAVLYTVTASNGGLDAASILLLDLRSGRPTTLIRGGTHAQYMPSGHLVYAAAGMLRAVGFDPARRIVVGASRSVVPHVLTTSLGASDAALAPDGTLVYVTGAAGVGTARTLTWVDRQGRETPIGAPPRPYAFPRLSPDGMRVATSVIEQNPDIWLWDLSHSTMTRVTSDPAVDTNPQWMPDGRHLVFSSNRGGALNLFNQVADSGSLAERLTDSPNGQQAADISAGGTHVVFTEFSPTTGADVMALRVGGGHEVVPLVRTPFSERNGTVSPDGRWLAYEADDSGPFQIYVRPFPEVGNGHWQVSPSGGTQPLWSRNGKELFYVAPDGVLMRVSMANGPPASGGAPTKVLEGRYVMSVGGNFPRNYDIAPDGQRFLMIKASVVGANSAPPQLVVVQHFDEELKRLVRVK
jgi:serine/threonine-protein kinase